MYAYMTRHGEIVQAYMMRIALGLLTREFWYPHSYNILLVLSKK